MALKQQEHLEARLNGICIQNPLLLFQQIQKYEKGTNGVSSNRLMQLSQFLKVPIIYFFEDFKEFRDVKASEETNDDLNYSFLTRTFTSLSKIQKEKILQILNNTSKFEKVG